MQATGSIATATLDDLYSQLEEEVGWKRKALDEAPDYLAAVATATATLVQAAPDCSQ
jgi:hypothetical protein